MSETRPVDSTQYVDLKDISRNPWNPHEMTEAEFNELMNSLQEDGQWRPILVVEMDVPDEYTPVIKTPYRIVDGQHLHSAMFNLFMDSKGPGNASVMVLGKNSQIPIDRQMLIGQTINHGMRGSVEDAQKTQEVLTRILEKRSAEVVARRLGLGVTGVRHLAKTPTNVSKKTAGGNVYLPKTGLSGAVRSINKERAAYTIALVFDTADELKTFEDQVNTLGELLAINRADYKGQAGRYRIAVVEAALEAAIKVESDV